MMVAVLQVCSDKVNKALNEGDKYSFTDAEIFKLIEEVDEDHNHSVCKVQNIKFYFFRLRRPLMKLWCLAHFKIKKNFVRTTFSKL